MKGRLTRYLTYAVLAAAGMFFAFPLYYLVVTSLKTRAELYAPVSTLYPHDPTLDAYTGLFVEGGFGQLLMNSAIAGFSATLLALAVALAIVYPLTRLPIRRRLRAFVLNWALALRFLPPVAVVVPYFLIVRTVGLYNNLIALTIVYALFNLPLSIWLLKGFLQEIPLEIEEAALVDGASRWRAFRTIILPLALPGLLSAGIIVFAFDWSEFMFAFILTATPASMTFPVGVQGLVTQYSIRWNDMAAGAVIAILVPLVFMIIARKYVMTALTFGVIREK